MSASHTPGPWELEPFSDTDEVISVCAGYSEDWKDGRLIKTAHWVAECSAAVDFDSDVDAALKGLLARGLTEWADAEYLWEVDAAKAAIQKAEAK